MSTNKTTPTRDDHARPSPYRPVDASLTILDIRNGDSRCGFTFIVSRLDFCGRSAIEIFELESLSVEHRLWVLAKFKANLRGLAIIERMKQWVSERLDLLKEYCDINGVPFDLLYTRSGSPWSTSAEFPHQCADEQQSQQTHNTKGNDKSGNGKKRRASMAHSKIAEPIIIMPSKTMRRRNVYSRIKVMLAKYGPSKSINKEAFLSELDAVRPHLLDM